MIRVLAVGKLKAAWAKEAAADYQLRVRRFAKLDLIDIDDSSPEGEGRAILARLGREYLVACDPEGELVDSEGLAALLGRHGSIAFAIGGPEGLSAELRARADTEIAFGRITLPHELARVVLLEQIYRGLSIRVGHPYHR